MPSLDTLKDAKAYILRQKVNNKEKLSREEKNWISYQVNHNTYFKSGIPVRGWRFDFSDILKVLWKELRVSLLCGSCLAAANFVKMQLVDRLLLGNAAVTPVVCLVVCLTIMFVVVFAKCVGCSLPLLAEKIGLDPAVMASPFITTIVDATSLLIYFRFASWLLGI